MSRTAVAVLCIWCCIAPSHAEEERTVDASPSEPAISDHDRAHWAFRPLADSPIPEVADERWGRNPIDRFVKAALDQNAIEPLPRAGRMTLLRRLCFDLTGLPSTLTQIEEFRRDDSPEAYERLVNRLLASSAYGERWAQHWLDLARFAETDGFEHDLVRPNAWRYRDWVIDALNRDVPYDEFIRLQLAGDELYPGDPAAAVATGFLLCGPDMPDLNLQEERRHQVLNEMTATVGAVVLGLQIGCAQCHDHKYDPISQYDFYRLRAFFDSAELFRDYAIPTHDESLARQTAEAAWTDEDRMRDRQRAQLEETARKRFREKNPDERPTLEVALAELGDADRRQHAELVELLRGLPELPELPHARVMRDGQARTSHLCLRGDFRRPGPVVIGGYPRVLAPNAAIVDGSSPLPRAQLGRWLTRAEFALPARVIANRLWQWHFGVGLSSSPSDFGVMGDEPTHPELLDWLARQFVSDGWSLKRFHRLVVTSETYQLASGPFDHEWTETETTAARAIWERSLARDPDDRLLWRRHPLRLEGEAIRDAMLTAAEQLSTRRGGPGIRPPLPSEVTITLLKDQWHVTGDKEDHRRRSIYLFVRRNLRLPMFDVFDRPDTNASCARRHVSTTATQSLVLLNSRFSLDCARGLAGVLLESERVDPARRIEGAYQRLFSRLPSEDEIRVGREFLERQARELRAEGRAPSSLARTEQPAACADAYEVAALIDLCLALLNTSEMVYLD